MLKHYRNTSIDISKSGVNIKVRWHAYVYNHATHLAAVELHPPLSVEFGEHSGVEQPERKLPLRHPVFRVA